MSDEVWRRDEIESPCVKICLIHPEARLCIGCYRSIDEIAVWSQMTPEDRREVMSALPDRAKLVQTRRGGRGRRRD